ncbi:MAG: hypothetical protein ACXWU0_02575 [Rhodoplanes sp.]
MTTEPTPEESARHLLDIFQTHNKMRAGQILVRGPARIEFLQNDEWHIQRFVAGRQYASQHRWIAMPSPTVLKLTDDGFFAYAARDRAFNKPRSQQLR